MANSSDRVCTPRSEPSRPGGDDVEQRVKTLEGIIRKTLWMACRYAHGRQSYAVGRYNDAARQAVDLEVVQHGESQEPVFAIDGTLSREMSGLSQDEFERAWDGWTKLGCIRTHCTPPGRPDQPEGGE